MHKIIKERMSKSIFISNLIRNLEKSSMLSKNKRSRKLGVSSGQILLISSKRSKIEILCSNMSANLNFPINRKYGLRNKTKRSE
jgi:hypothetical protein